MTWVHMIMSKLKKSQAFRLASDLQDVLTKMQENNIEPQDVLLVVQDVEHKWRKKVIAAARLNAPKYVGHLTERLRDVELHDWTDGKYYKMRDGSLTLMLGAETPEGNMIMVTGVNLDKLPLAEQSCYNAALLLGEVPPHVHDLMLETLSHSIPPGMRDLLGIHLPGEAVH